MTAQGTNHGCLTIDHSVKKRSARRQSLQGGFPGMAKNPGQGHEGAVKGGKHPGRRQAEKIVGTELKSGVKSQEQATKRTFDLVFVD